jgi:hypothetical protein
VTIDTFAEVWVIDFEFQALPGERPDPVCLVAHELRSGRWLHVWRDALHRIPCPYSTDARTLVIGFYISAEFTCTRVLGWHRISDTDRPARTPASTVALLARAATAGAHISAVCTHIHQHEGASGVRRILGLLALAKKHGLAVVEDAAAAALEIGVPTYRFVRKYVERRPPVPLTLRQVDPIIRQLTLYRDLIDRKTGDLP